MYAIHHMPSIWGADADEFKPERWFDENLTKKITNYNYLPFLTGSRSCLGNKLALNEIKVFLAILIRNFEFHEVEGVEIKKKIIFSYRPEPALLWVKEIDNS